MNLHIRAEFHNSHNEGFSNLNIPNSVDSVTTENYSIAEGEKLARNATNKNTKRQFNIARYKSLHVCFVSTAHS